MKAASTPRDPHQEVTDRILAALEGGIIPWRKGWNASFGLPKNLATGHVYQGINAFLLSLCPVGDYPLFMTYKQARELGGQVREGEHGQKIIFTSHYERKGKPGQPQPAEQEGGYSFLKEFTVFNICQIDGLNVELPTLGQREFEPNQVAERVLGEYLGRQGAPLLYHGGGRAYYQPFLDYIQMPNRNTFRSEQAYYRTALHEVIHSTGAAGRLNRPGITEDINYGSQPYGFEELVAEMGSAFLNAEIGYEPEPEGDQHASYIQNWLRIIRADKKLVIKAAAQAQKAANFVRGIEAPAYVERRPGQPDEAEPLALAA